MSDPSALPREPARKVVVITCMDARIDPLRGFGLELGDAHVLRNAGAEVSDDVLRSVAVSRNMGTTEAWIVAHTDCAARGGEEQVARTAARHEAQKLRDWGITTRALFYDFASGEVVDA